MAGDKEVIWVKWEVKTFSRAGWTRQSGRANQRGLPLTAPDIAKPANRARIRAPCWLIRAELANPASMT
jgi:hypothetical protein